MTSDDPKAELSRAARDAAVAWHVRLASDAAEEADWLGFEGWLEEAPDNAAAYQQVEQVWRELDAAGDPGVARLPSRARPRRPAWPVALAAAAAVAAVVIGLTLRRPDLAPTTTYETAKGVQREIALADGSRIRLNTGSHIAVTLARRERRVAMGDAEAVFDVAKDAARPFVIEAGDRRIRVVGTEFDVLHHAGAVRVAVRRGLVQVSDAAADAGAFPIVQLAPGQGLEHREGVAGDRLTQLDPDKAFAWTERRLIYDDARLEDVAADLSRYLATPIQVSAAARDLRLTAVLDLDKEDAMLRRLAGFVPVRAVREGGVYRLDLRPRRP